MKYTMVAVEREYASGGRAIGELAADKLGIPCYGHEILELAAERMNLAIDEAEKLEETASGSLIYSIFLAQKAAVGDMANQPTAEALSQMEAKIIRELAAKGRCVIVGRGCVTALEGREDMLRVFVQSDYESRRKRAVEQYHIAPDQVDATVKAYDKQRARYYQANTMSGWHDPGNYHLTLNSGKLGLETCAGIIANLL